VSGFQVIDTAPRCRLGEGPLWSDRQQALFWVDILGQSVFRLRLEDAQVARWDMPEMIGWLIEREHGAGFVAGFQSGFAYLELDPLRIRPIANPEPECTDHRMNDAKADVHGRIWAGTMPVAADRPTGALYRLDAQGRVTCWDRGYIVTNGPAFSADGRFAYHNDSGRALVYRFELDADGGLCNRSVFLEFGPQDGKPDGMTVDAEGGLWIAMWGGARVSRFTPDGLCDRSIGLPASQITSCCFAGPALDRLFVTSASEGVRDEPLAGSLFEVDARVRGFPARRFSG
jgi:sugar lactone lactonase YvrE